MSLIEALVLGIVQGLTEFLPISSSAHLIIVPLLLGWPQPGLTFTLALHLGTLMAVLTYFRHDLLSLALALPRALVRRNALHDPDARLALLIILGSVPAGLVGLVLGDVIESQFHTDVGVKHSLTVIAVALIGVALLLWLAERLAEHSRSIKELRAWQALVIGGAQALALIPGVSRSGSTITAGLFVGLNRPAAAQFSFLLGTPIILAAALKQLVEVARSNSEAIELLPFVAGFLSSTIVGYLCIALLLRYLRTRTTAVFIIYRLVLGLGLIIVGLMQ